MTNPLKKLKQLLAPVARSDNQAASPKPLTGTEHLSPVSQTITKWLEHHQWKYQHHTPNPEDELRTHYFVMGFRSDELEWNCVIRVYEKSQLINLQGVLLNEIDPAYYLTTLTAINLQNQSLTLGSLDLDMTAGVMRAKISFDGEFSLLSTQALDCYMQGLVSLLTRAKALFDGLMDNPSPAQTLDDITNDDLYPADLPEHDDGYFLASTERQ